MNQGTIVNQLADYEAAPIAHTIIDGVDIWNGHLTVSTDDITIEGRGPELDFTRTYASGSDVTNGTLGAGWNNNYNMTLVQNDDGSLTLNNQGTDENSPGRARQTPARQPCMACLTIC